MSHRRRPTSPTRQPASSPEPTPSKPIAQSSAGKTQAPLDPRRRILFILLAAVVLPLLLVGVGELGLRVAGYGYSTSFFKPLRIGNEDYLVDNDKFGWRFFPPEISRSPTPMRLLAHKPPGTYRIFLLGESAALGDPEPAFGMGRYLQALLQERYPQTRFEIIPAAMTAINSHAVLPIARECAKHEGDLWIIYMGNNEMIGPFGAITVFGSQSPPLWYVRFSLAMQRTRIGQLVSSLGRRWLGRDGQHGPSWGGMQMFLKNQIAPGDPRKDRVYAAFKRNLEDILQAGRNAGVPMVLSTVAVNLKDCAPFGSLSKPNAASEPAAAFEKLKQAVVESQTHSNFAGAIAQCEQAAQFDPHYAELQFRWGQCLLSLTNPAAAKPHFQAACDDDSLPFRSDSRINGLIKETATRFAGRDLLLFDAVASVAANTSTGIAGDETFYEHVHFHFDGNYRIARGLADQVATLLPASMTQSAAPNWSDQDTCEKDLGLTDWNRRDVFDNMRRRLLQPPFTGQEANAQKARAWDARIKQLQPLLNQSNAVSARAVYLQAISRSPQDFRLHMNYAAFLEATHNLSEAVTEWKQVETLLPHHYLAAYQIGRLLASINQNDDARQWLSRALIARPDLSEGWYELGRVQSASGQFQAALASFQRARQLVSAEPRYQYEIAKALIKLLRRDEAIDQLEQTVRVAPNFWEAHSLLGEELAFANRVPEARREFETAIKLKPDLAIAHFNLGVALVREGQLADAKREFEEVMRLDPENPVARNALAQLSAPRK